MLNRVKGKEGADCRTGAVMHARSHGDHYGVGTAATAAQDPAEVRHLLRRGNDL
jgi:hypothetical protein